MKSDRLGLIARSDSKRIVSALEFMGLSANDNEH